MATIDDTTITIIGHPWAPIGMGEQLRSHYKGLEVRIGQQGYAELFHYDHCFDWPTGPTDPRRKPDSKYAI